MAAPSKLLGIGLAVSNIPSAITQGIAAGDTQYNTEQTRAENRDLARQRKEKGDLDLARMGREDKRSALTDNAKTEQLKATLEETKRTAEAASDKVLRQESFTALNNYWDSKGDPRAMNQFLQDNKDNPTVKSQYGDVVRIDTINPNSDDHKRLLKEAGLTDAELDAADGKKDGKIDWTKLKSRFVVATRSDGKTKISDMLHISALSGYNRYASQQNRDRMKEMADINKSVTGRVEPKTAELRNANRLATAEANVKAGTATNEDHAFIKLMKTKLGGVVAGKTDMGDIAQTTWKNSGFDKLSQEELQANPEARKLVHQIELAHDISEAHQKELLDINAMTSLSAEAGNINERQTGIWDKFTSGFTSYTNDEIGGKSNRAAYGAFINQFRHNLFGSALTDGELAAFKEAYGGLGQKTGPVLAGLRAALVQIKSKFKTISDLNEPEVIKFRAGRSIEDLKTAMAGIDQRIAFYDAVANGMTPDEAMKATQTPTQTPQTVEDVSKFIFNSQG